MTLTPGSRLGAYEVVSLLGEGGMGQVYRATDTNLKRQVALKVLPASVAGDVERLARFQREAEVLAALNHPHIAQIFGLERSAGTTALVMELVEGEDLSARIARGPIPLDEALPIARQIAEALEAAHEQGIVHRDLKPANIKVRPDGTVKVLDFGLAKAIEPVVPGRGEAMQAATITSPGMTQAGAILGTAAYMAPEQAKGRPVDRRADIWAFGCVLYEMLTGRRAFPGEDITDTIVAVVSKEPDWSALPSGTPAPVQRLLVRCLKKDLKARVRDIGDARQRIEDLLSGDPDGAQVSPRAIAARPPASVASRLLPWAIAAAAVVALGTVLVFDPQGQSHPQELRPLVRLDVDLGEDVALPVPVAGQSARSIAISPDGMQLVYVSGSPAKLFVRRLDQPVATELAGTEGASGPFFSPDGQWIGFVAGRKVSKMSSSGGAVVAVTDTAYRGAVWGPRDTIVFGGLPKAWRVGAGGGTPEAIAEARGGELSLSDPDILPDGNAVLFTADNYGPVDRSTVEVLTLADGQRRTLVQGGASPRYLATARGTGHLVYVKGATLFAVPFDPIALQTRGNAVPMVDDVDAEASVGSAQFDISQTGTLIYVKVRGSRAVPRVLRWQGRSGAVEQTALPPGAYSQLSVSPNGRYAALTVAADGRTVQGGFVMAAGSDIWLYDLNREVLSRLTTDGISTSPAWSPDSRFIVFSSLANGILQVRADGARPPQVLVQSTANLYPGSFSPDGSRMAFMDSAGGGRIGTVSIQSDPRQLTAGTPEMFLTGSAANSTAPRTRYRSPAFSPNGRWLAYQSNETGTDEVFVRTFSGTSADGDRWQVSSGGGARPRWSAKGDTLLYESGGELLAVPYTAQGDTFVADKPRRWTGEGSAAAGVLAGGATWDLSPDGARVAVLAPVTTAAPRADHVVTFLQNFFDEVRRKAPLGQ